MALLKAFHSRALCPGEDGAEVPRRIQVFPKGRFPGLDGRGPYFCDPAAVAAATLAYYGGIAVPMDYDHQLERAAENGQCRRLRRGQPRGHGGLHLGRLHLQWQRRGREPAVPGGVALGNAGGNAGKDADRKRGGKAGKDADQGKTNSKPEEGIQ